PVVRPVEGQPVRHQLLFGLWLATQFVGFFLASYGVLRESFANLAQEPGFGEGRYGEGTFGGVLSWSEEFLVNLGTKVRFLPADRALTVTDRKRNAAWARARRRPPSPRAASRHAGSSRGSARAGAPRTGRSGSGPWCRRPGSWRGSPGPVWCSACTATGSARRPRCGRPWERRTAWRSGWGASGRACRGSCRVPRRAGSPRSGRNRPIAC